MQDLWTTERDLWLEGVDAYAQHMAPQCLMLLGPMGILGRDAILESLQHAPRWSSVEMSEQTIVGGENVTVLAYKAVGTRNSGPAYLALCSSTYSRHDEAWKIIQHQQTPL